MGNRWRRSLTGPALVAAALTAGPQAAAAPGDLPPSADLDQFYPGQGDLPGGWSFDDQEPAAVPSANSTTPPGCSPVALFPLSPRRVAAGPGNSALLVRVLRAPAGLQTIRSWAEKCASFTALGGGGTTGRNWMSVQAAEAPSAEALAYRVVGQGPFARPELELAGPVRGVLVLVSQSGPEDGGAAAQAYRATAAKINAWRG